MVQTPSKATLKKYGLSEPEWKVILERQNGVCFVCQKEPTKGRLCIDHEHVKGWKKMPPENRKRFVRGLLCWVCNHYYLGRGININKAKNVVKYLEEYNGRHAFYSLMSTMASVGE
jgi:hypothetical protein